MPKPYCFVLMPFGRKSDENGKVVEFDVVYDEIIKPAIEDAELEPIRADEEVLGGIIHKPMFERLMLCDYAVADLTTANANVFYELGIRHSARPHTTVLMAASEMRLPFDVAMLRAIPYELDKVGRPANPRAARKQLAERLIECRGPAEDSPLYQLLTDFPRPDIARLKTDIFRDVVEYSRQMKDRIRAARDEGQDAVREIEKGIARVSDADPAIVIDLFLSYRAVGDHAGMIELVDKMPGPLKQTVLVQEQLGFALNRAGRRAQAERVLKAVIDTHGPSSETNGLLGRVYKDRWEDARKAEAGPRANGYLRKAIETYLTGFEADFRDAYPGVNAVTLMEMTTPPDSRQGALIPVVTYAVERRLATKNPDYWDYATLLELAVLARDEDLASEHLESALTAEIEGWMPESTANNLRMIREIRESRGEECDWIRGIEEGLVGASR
uniref:MAP3K TRAFs-binding domain-containing protein n=1 Tax=Candidatus Kentrum sp. FW TaxID=2126338 RepID=A0A450TZQ6_9GAMM|nr:MAG: protein of unknown function (DUF4071) [Candidatus Kentron sp. FW]